MKKVLGSILVFAFAFTSLVSQGGSSPAIAEADPTGFAVDCTSQSLFDTSLAAITWPSGTSRVVTAVIDDTFDITNSGTSNCTFSSGTGLDSDSLAIANGESRTVTVANSGSFTITPDGGVATTFFVDACSLPGSGISNDPWLVATLADFVKVGQESTTLGETSCSFSGSYLQTANISNVDTDDLSATKVSGVFTGTYDGDHYDISYFSGGASGVFQDREPLFRTLGPGGVIKKLSLSGNIRNSSTESSSLVEDLFGGTISEVRSSVLIQVDDDNDAVIGGLVAFSGGTDQNGLIIYSKFDGRIEWLESAVGSEQEGPTIGGLVGMAEGTGTTEIRDSYSRAAISFNSRGLTGSVPSTHPNAAVFAGGLVGSDGFTEIVEDDFFDTNKRTHAASSVSIVRSYFAGSFTNTCVGTASQCNIDSSSHVFTGGLIGVSEGRDDTGDRLISAFWLSTSATNAIGGIVVSAAADPLVYNAPQPLDYSSTDFFPIAVPVSAAELRTLNTFTTEEDQLSPGNPGGTPIVAAASNRSSATIADYLWAITGERSTFVPSTYTATAADDPGSASDQASYFNRELYIPADDGPKEYLRKRAGVLANYGGQDPRSTTTYTTLGNVWEICPAEDFPTLVWEEETCGGGGDSGGNPGGLSDAEYAEFLRSGLSLADFLAQRLAATGPSDAALGLGGLSAVLLGLVGAALVLIARRQVSRKPR